MDDVKLFASLRPEAAPLYPAERASLRRELFGGEHTADTPVVARGGRPNPIGAGVLHDLRDGGEAGTRPPRRSDDRGGSRGWRVGAAAAVLVAVGIGALWVAVAQRTDQPTAPAQSPEPRPPDTMPPSSLPSEDSDGFAPPRVTIDQPGWTLTRATDSAVRAPALVLLDPAHGFDGPWIAIERMS